MTTAAEIVDQTQARLVAQCPKITILRNVVPKELPADDSGNVYPYAVIWEGPGMGDDAAEDLCGDTDGASILDQYITVASGKAEWTGPAAAQVRRALDRWQPTGNVERLRDNQTWAPVQLDTEVLPNRHYVALVFRSAYKE